MSVISEHLMLSQEDLELEANLGYIESSRLAWAIETWDSLSEPRGAGIDAKSKRNLLFQCTGVIPDLKTRWQPLAPIQQVFIWFPEAEYQQVGTI